MTRASLRDWLYTPLAGVALGVLFGGLYGVAMRLTSRHSMVGGVMTFAFICVVPIVIGALSLLPVIKPRLAHAFLLPTLATTLTLGLSLLLRVEGAICIVFALPIALVFSVLGGVMTWSVRRETERGDKRMYAVVLLPFVVAPIENRFDSPIDMRVVESDIAISADAAAVWEEIVEVPTIGADERRPALFTSIGFPAPLSAVVDRRELGGVREARFEGGVLFLERITRFEPKHALAFDIDSQEELIPPTTLDPHVTIGGPYFDVLEGEYEIEETANGVVLHLKSRLRVSTHFNVYAGAWADRVMASIQDNILDVVRRRAERRFERARSSE
ncbi:MAG: hypothetical protein K8S98_09515 [Planctomycetes bacterium]|nr:hypothetical protein [Planctomycetota bacterium]